MLESIGGPEFWSAVATANAVLSLATAIEFRAALGKARWTRGGRRSAAAMAVAAVALVALNLLFLTDAIRFAGMSVGQPDLRIPSDAAFAYLPVVFPLCTFLVAFAFSAVLTALDAQAKGRESAR